MAIDAITGLIGGGKTAFAVGEYMAPHIARGGMVFTNIDVRFDPWVIGNGDTSFKRGDGFKKLVMERYRKIPVPEQFVFLKPDQIMDFDKHILWGSDTMHVQVVIDELHLWCDQFAEKALVRNLSQFLTQSRKASVDILFLSQHIDNVASTFRRNVRFRWTAKDASDHELPGWGKLAPKGVHVYVACMKMTNDIVKVKTVKIDDLVKGAYVSKAIVNDMAAQNCAPAFVLEDVPRVPVWKRLGLERVDVVKAGYAAALGLAAATKLSIGL